MVTRLVRGVDVSAYQKVIDWPTLRQARRDLTFVVNRVAEWRDNTPSGGLLDEQVEKNVWQQTRCGLVPGLYNRVNPVLNTAEREAAAFVTRITALGGWGAGHLVPAFDVEPTEQPEDAAVNWPAWVREFINAWFDLAPTRRLRWYASGSFFDARYGGVLDIPLEVSLWVGHWAGPYSTPPNVELEQWAGRTGYTFGGRTLMHQYTSKGSLPGITGPVDLDCLMPGVQLADVMQ